jgi:hypothetical protein
VEKSVKHDVRQNRVGVGTMKEFEEIMAEIYLPSTTLRGLGIPSGPYNIGSVQIMLIRMTVAAPSNGMRW